jgi:hypothetical protein
MGWEGGEELYVLRPARLIYSPLGVYSAWTGGILQHAWPCVRRLLSIGVEGASYLAVPFGHFVCLRIDIQLGIADGSFDAEVACLISSTSSVPHCDLYSQPCS